LKILLVEYHFAQEQKRAVELGTAVPITDSPGANGHGEVLSAEHT
jgi:hypothetical protein